MPHACTSLEHTQSTLPVAGAFQWERAADDTIHRPGIHKTFLLISRTNRMIITRKQTRNFLLFLLISGCSGCGFLTMLGFSKPAEVADPTVDRPIYSHI